MFNTQHILYMVVSGVLTAIVLVLAAKWLKTEQCKNRLLKFFAIITVILHYSDVWVDFFASGGEVYVTSVHILPVYPCNVMMWLLLIAALMKNKWCLLFQLLSECCFYVGTVCGVVGIVLNANFGNTPTLADYSILKGMLSHSTMLAGCLYMLTGHYIRIRPMNAISTAFGLGIFVICGLLVDGLYDYFGMEAPDGMFLRHNPYFPVSPVWLGIGVVIVMYVVLSLLQRNKKKEMSESHA